MNSGGGVRPSKLWHWFAVAFLAATFLAEPRASMALTWQIFQGAGAVGGELLTGEPEPDVLNLKPGPESEPDALDSGTSLQAEEDGDWFDSAPPSDSPVIDVGGDGIRSVLDHGVDGVLELHRRVETIRDAGGLTVEIGDPS